eukprot:PhM_4_TR2389/c1_g1_i4/m.10324
MSFSSVIHLVFFYIPCAFLALCIGIVLERKRHRSKYKGPVIFDYPTPPGLRGFVLGSMADALNAKNAFEHLMALHRNKTKFHRPVFAMFGPISSRLYLVHPEDMVYVMNQTSIFRKPNSVYGRLQRMIGKGLVTISDPKTHMQHRKAIVPAFSNQVLKSMSQHIMARHVQMLVEEWGVDVDKAAKKGKPLYVNVQEGFDAMALSVIVGAAFKLDVTKVTNSSDAVHLAFAEVMDTARLNWTYMLPKGYHIPTANNRRQTAARSRIWSIASRIVRRARNKAQGTLDKDGGETSEDDAAVIHAQTLFDNLLESQLPESDILGHSITFLFAGHETSSKALTWTSYLLATNPKAQERLAEELCAAFPEGTIPTTETLKQCPYLTAVINESLRVFPPVAVVVREVMEPVTLPGSGAHLEKGAWVTIPTYVAHHNPNVWGDDVEEFRPERWEHLDVAELQREGKFIPFLIGMRNCIGREFALQEVAMCMATVVRQFKLSWVEGQEHPLRTIAVTLRPTRPFQLQMERRSE